MSAIANRLDGYGTYESGVHTLQGIALVPGRAICKYDLHGRCNSVPCEDAHIDDVFYASDGDAVIDVLGRVLQATAVPKRFADSAMLAKAVLAQSTIAKARLAKGADTPGCVAAFMDAIAQLCDFGLPQIGKLSSQQ